MTKLLISTTVNIVWNPKTKRHYVDAGYTYTKMGDEFAVDVSDLTSGSNVEVSVMCDYCGEILSIPYYRYLCGHQGAVQNDCCDKCKKEKIRDSLMKRYGVSTPDQVDGARERAKATNLRRYGFENPFSSRDVQKKIAQTNLEKYGVENVTQCEAVKEKTRQTCLERYGAESHMKTEKYRKMFSGESSPRWKPDKDTVARERDRSCHEYGSWRDSVFQRDHYRCRCCGGRGDSKFGIQAHHIENYSSNPDKRFVVENGITLCHDCHKEFHRIYGRQDNNLSQLKLFFLNHGKKVC